MNAEELTFWYQLGRIQQGENSEYRINDQSVVDVFRELITHRKFIMLIFLYA